MINKRIKALISACAICTGVMAATINQNVELSGGLDNISDVYENVNYEYEKLNTQDKRLANGIVYINTDTGSFATNANKINYQIDPLKTNNFSEKVIPVELKTSKTNHSVVRLSTNKLPYNVLANNSNPIGKYVPPNLTVVKVWGQGNNYLDNIAASQMEKMFADAKKSGIKLYLVSGYRSYSQQQTVWNNSVRTQGKAHTEKYVAYPGKSEHQTGFSADITGASYKGLEERFDKTKEYKWLSANAHKYGFILRYPKGKSQITGYEYEPWHYRYLGVELAAQVKSSGLTYEEYLTNLGITYAKNPAHINQLYKDAYDATQNAISNRSQYSINLAREAIIKLKGTSVESWAMTEFSKQVDTVQHPYLVKIVNSINKAEESLLQRDIDEARLTIDKDLPDVWRYSYSSGIDKIQQRMMDTAEDLLDKAKASNQEEDIQAAKEMLLDISTASNNDISRWAMNLLSHISNDGNSILESMEINSVINDKLLKNLYVLY